MRILDVQSDWKFGTRLRRLFPSRFRPSWRAGARRVDAATVPVEAGSRSQRKQEQNSARLRNDQRDPALDERRSWTSDAHDAYVAERPVSPEDIAATVYYHLGIDGRTVAFPDRAGRPLYLVENGEPIRELVDGGWWINSPSRHPFWTP